MYQTISFPLCNTTPSEYGGWIDFLQELLQLECDGIEAICGAEPLPQDVQEGLAIVCHLTYYPDWLGVCREDSKRLEQKFGTIDAVRQFELSAQGCTLYAEWVCRQTDALFKGGVQNA